MRGYMPSPTLEQNKWFQYKINKFDVLWEVKVLFNCDIQIAQYTMVLCILNYKLLVLDS